MNIFVHIAMKLASDCEKHADQSEWFKSLVVLDVPKYVFGRAYYHLVREGKVIAIENLEGGIKKEMWETAKELAGGRLANNELMTEFCRVLYALEYFLTQKK